MIGLQSEGLLPECWLLRKKPSVIFAPVRLPTHTEEIIAREPSCLLIVHHQSMIRTLNRPRALSRYLRELVRQEAFILTDLYRGVS